jgi:predicted nucleotide-binding protein
MLLDELDKHTQRLSFAVVIMTGDDLGRAKDQPGDERYRARQNVVLEFGYLLGKYPRNKVFVLHEEGVEMPSDLGGVLYIPYDRPGAWQMLLSRGVKNAKIPINTGFLTG